MIGGTRTFIIQERIVRVRQALLLLEEVLPAPQQPAYGFARCSMQVGDIRSRLLQLPWSSTNADPNFMLVSVDCSGHLAAAQRSRVISCDDMSLLEHVGARPGEGLPWRSTNAGPPAIRQSTKSWGVKHRWLTVGG